VHAFGRRFDVRVEGGVADVSESRAR
jgi:hypothetical protein